EQDYDAVRFNLNKYDDNPNVEALLFRWLHFFGSYNRIGVGRQWYRREVRVFRNTGNVTSWADAQGFRVKNSDGSMRKIRAVQTDARIFHYGWVRHPRIQVAKAHAFQRLYHDDAWLRANIPTSDEFQYYCFETAPFTGTHPASMNEAIERDREWTSKFDPVKAKAKRPFAVAVTDWFEKKTGIRVGEFKNFTEVA
ncbi:MAG: glycosyltransferase family 2 protein, partial [Candidatus Kapabacteria bacterium]|nr:glycosyltransferase family 2 protein [Candidatus Kapabacteria bacterium]